MYIVLVGNITVGFHAVGTFEQRTDALKYCKDHVALGMFLIMQVYTPEEKRDAPFLV